MTDEAPLSEDTPTTPDGTEIPWQKRYEDLRPEYDRTTQQLARFKSDPNALIEFIQETHPDLLAEEDEEEDTDIYEPDEAEQPLTRAEFKAWQDEQDRAAKARDANQQFESDFKTFVGDRDLSPQGEAFVRFAATKGDIKGPDDLKKTVDDWFAYEDSLRGPTRKTPPTPPPAGKAGEAKHDPRDRNARRARMAAAIEAANQQ